MDNSLWLDNFLNMYRELGTDNFDVLKTVYHPDIEFQDPLHHVSGISALTHYFENLYTQVTSCYFHIEHTFEVNDEASVYWTMQFSHKQLNGQKPIEVQGHSHLKMLDGQVVYHRDYLDVGSMLYEHIPVLGCAIKSIKKESEPIMRIMITGATSGIGQSLAIDYAQQGHQVIACGRNPDKLQALVDSHETDIAHSSITPLCFDLTDYHNFPELDQDKPLDLLILNAGDCEYINDPVNFDAELFERVININLISIGYALKAWLKNIKPGGRLVLVSSSASFLPLPRAEAYGASKAALTYLGRTLSVDLAEHNIHVSIVHPGFVETPLTERNTFSMPMIISSEAATQRIVNGIAQGKSEIDFPRRFIMLMKLLRMLPTPVWQKLASRMV